MESTNNAVDLVYSETKKPRINHGCKIPYLLKITTVILTILFKVICHVYLP